MVGQQNSRAARRKVSRIISADEILDAAVVIVDSEGLSALTMRRLADATGVAPMTIYGFFHGKDDLVTRLRARVLQELPPPLDPDRDWRERIVHELAAMHSAFQRHHGLLELLSDGTDAVPMLDALRERLIEIMRSGGLDDQTIIDGLGSLVALTLGFAVGGRARDAVRGGNAYRRLEGVSEQQFPHLRSMAADYPKHWADSAYFYGIDAVLAAMEPVARRRDRD